MLHVTSRVLTQNSTFITKLNKYRKGLYKLRAPGEDHGLNSVSHHITDYPITRRKRNKSQSMLVRQLAPYNAALRKTKPAMENCNTKLSLRTLFVQLCVAHPQSSEHVQRMVSPYCEHVHGMLSPILSSWLDSKKCIQYRVRTWVLVEKYDSRQT